MSAEVGQKVAAALKGITRSKKTRTLISVALKGKYVGNKHHGFGKALAPEHRRKLADANRGHRNHNFGKPISDDVKRKISQALKGRVISEHTRRKLSAITMAQMAIFNPNLGKPRSEETRLKISANRKGKRAGKDHPFFGTHRSEETRRKMSETIRKNKEVWNNDSIE